MIGGGWLYRGITKICYAEVQIPRPLSRIVSRLGRVLSWTGIGLSCRVRPIMVFGLQARRRWQLTTKLVQRCHLSWARQASSCVDRSILLSTFHLKATVKYGRRELMPSGRQLSSISLASSFRADAYTEDVGNSSFLPSSFSCRKCRLKFAKEPVITFCGHVFCWPCLYQSISRGVGLLRGNCPTCRSAVDLFRPTKTVIPINDVKNEAPWRRPGWVPSRPNANGNMHDSSPNYSWGEIYSMVFQMKHSLRYTLFRDTKEKMDAISLEIEGRLEKLSSQLVNAQQEQDDEHSPSKPWRSQRKEHDSSETTKTISTSLLTAEWMQVEDAVMLWLDHVYSVFRDYAFTSINNVNDLNYRMSEMCVDLTRSHFRPCIKIPHLTYLSERLFDHLGVRNTTPRCYRSRKLPSQEAQTQSFSTPYQESPIQPLLLSSQEVPIQSFVTRSTPRVGYHSLASQKDNGFDEAITLLTGKKFSYCNKKMSQDILEIENLLEDLLSKLHKDNEELLRKFKVAETMLKSTLLGLLDGWKWVAWGIRDIKMNDTREVNRRLSKLSDDWIEVVGRDFTDDLGPIYFHDAELRSKASPSLTVGSHLSLLTQLSTFCCNICGKVNDAIKEPIVTHCGHLFCWHCLCSCGTVLSQVLHCFCPVCNCSVTSGQPYTASAKMIPVSGISLSADDDKSPPWPVLRRLKIPALNGNIKVLRMTATKIAKVGLIRQEETEKSKRAFDALKQKIKLVPERLKQLLAISN